VKADATLALRASVDRRPGGDEINLIVNELIPLEELSSRFTSGVLIRVREEAHGETVLSKLKEIVRGYPGDKPLKLRLDLADGGCVTVDCPKNSVTIDPELRRRVDELLGAGHFRLLAAQRAPAPHATNGRRRALVRS
jgi:DNA polymerase-3 subunit alpha